MKLRIFLLSCLLSLACFAEPTKHPSGAYVFDLPAGWAKGKEPELWHNKSQKRVLNAIKVDLPGEDKLDAWAQSTAKEGEEKWSDLKIVDGTLGKKKAKVVTAIDKSQGKPMFLKIVMSINKTTGATLVFVDEDGDSKEFEGNIKTVTDSFHWK